jgi:predicted nucleotide-binding protein
LPDQIDVYVRRALNHLSYVARSSESTILESFPKAPKLPWSAFKTKAGISQKVALEFLKHNGLIQIKHRPGFSGIYITVIATRGFEYLPDPEGMQRVRSTARPVFPIPHAGATRMEDLDESSLDILEYLGGLPDDCAPSVEPIAKELSLDLRAASDGLILLEAGGYVESIRPDDYPVQNGRFSISDRGRALLAVRRKAAREDAVELSKIAQLVNRLIKDDLNLSREALRREIQRLLAECAARGILHSGAMIATIEEAIIRELRARAERTVATLGRVLQSSSRLVNYDEIRQMYDEATHDMFADANETFADTIRASGIRNVSESRLAALVGAEEDILGKTHAELELLAAQQSKGQAQVSFSSESDNSPKSNKVFITHGHDHAVRDAIQAYLFGLGLVPVVLEDAANVGQTIIEKLEKNADVSYAVVILSPDDVGRSKNPADAPLQPRARQNVVFELGYLMAKLGRRSVAVLLPDPALERPTNIEGIVWIQYDSGGGWKYRLQVELKAVGFALK